MSDLSNVGESLAGKPPTAAAGEIAWLAEGEIPKAAVTLLAGEPGSGKSFVACTLAASVSQVPDARVVIAHGEPAERVHGRLVRAGAEISRIALLGVGAQRPVISVGFGIQDSAFGMPQAEGGAIVAGLSTDKSKIQSRRAGTKSKIVHGLEVLIAWLSGAASVSRADLIVVDDLESVVGGVLSAAELAEASARLDELARTSGAAVLAVVRSATTTEGRVTARSLDRLMRAADVVWTVAADREMAGHRCLVPLKNNLAALPRGKTFQIVEGRVEWLKEAVPDDALMPGSRRSAERADRQTAGMWLVEALALSDIPSRLLYAQARQCGFSRNTILRAAHKMGMHSHKSAFDGCWKYSLRDVPREVVDVYRTHPKWFTDGRGHSEGFRVQAGVGGQGSGGREGCGIQDSAFSVPEAAPHVENAAVAGRSPDRLADCDRRSPEIEDARDLRSAPLSGSGDPARTGDRSKIPTNVEESQGAQESQVMRMANHQSQAPSLGSAAPSPESRAPSPESPAPSPQFGSADLPSYVPPEPELRDHLGRKTAKAIENWERWYHQWHREIRAYNPKYHFNT